MLSEELEFQICCYADGAATVEETRAVEAALANDAEARQLLAEYQSLIAAVGEAGETIPSVRWHGLASHLSGQIQQVPAARSVRAIGPRLALAASVLIAIGLGMLAAMSEQAPHPAEQPPVAVAPAQIDVAGPVAEVSEAAPQISVSVEPTVSVSAPQSQVQYGLDLVADDQRVQIAPSELVGHPGTGE
jgi:hypothetical protein